MRGSEDSLRATEMLDDGPKGPYAVYGVHRDGGKVVGELWACVWALSSLESWLLWGEGSSRSRSGISVAA